MNLTRLMRALWYLRPSQVVYRAAYRIERAIGLHRLVPRLHDLVYFDEASLERIRGLVEARTGLSPPDLTVLADLRKGRFTFLRHTVDSDGAAPPWHDVSAPKLWRYQLHYFDYLRLLCRPGSPPSDRALALSWMHSWAESCPCGASPAWDAFVIASRLMNWAEAAAILGGFDDALRQSFAIQARYLARHLEYDVRANHLLKNAQALVVAASLLGEETPLGRRLLRLAMPLLETETGEQILPDGGHYERSVMYHAQVLDDYLLVHAALPAPPDWLHDAVLSMARFLEEMLHPDGSIPLFADASRTLRTSAGALVSLARGECLQAPSSARTGPACAFADSGYYGIIGAEPGTRLLIRAGEPGPRYQLGHAHCDALSYELFAGGKPILVDTGVHEYESGEWRTYCRGTSAHNTLRLHGREQMECWGAFRVGRRYRARCLAFGPYGDGWLMRGEHDGFRPYRHTRAVHYRGNGLWVVADRIDGPSECGVESFLHLHPDFQCLRERTGWKAESAGDYVQIVFPEHVQTRCLRGEEKPLQGWHCPEFGLAQAACCILSEGRFHCPVVTGYAIVVNCAVAVEENVLSRWIEEALTAEPSPWNPD